MKTIFGRLNPTINFHRNSKPGPMNKRSGLHHWPQAQRNMTHNLPAGVSTLPPEWQDNGGPGCPGNWLETIRPPEFATSFSPTEINWVWLMGISHWKKSM